MFLLEDRDHPELCPVAQLLALAIADRALVGVEHPDDLKRISTPSGRRTALVRIRDEIRDIPVLRCLEGRDLPISSTLIMKSNALNYELESLGQRAGYAKRFSAYVFRRGHGNLLDSKSSCSRLCPGLTLTQIMSPQPCAKSGWGTSTPAHCSIISQRTQASMGNRSY